MSRWIILALVPAAAGIVSLVLTPEDFRSSGFVAGLGLTILLVGVTLALRAPWRDRSGVGAWVARGRVALVVVVGLVGLAEGIPEFAQERLGWWVSADDRGLLAVAPVDGGFVAVGHPQTGAAWTSTDGRTWTPVRLPQALDGLELRALAPAADSLWAIAQDQAAAGLLVEIPGLDQAWRAGGRAADDRFGQKPSALAEVGGHVITFASTYGNDVAFFRGDPREALVLAEPTPVFDHGFSARNLACTADGCVAVGEHWDPAAAFWHTSDGHAWELVNLDPGASTATGIAFVGDGWLAVGRGVDGAAVWRSSDGRTWGPEPVLGLADAAFDGLAVLGDVATAYGHDTTTDRPLIWTLDDARWTRIELAGAPGSRVRDVTADAQTTVAIGVDGDSLAAAAWVSTQGSAFRYFTLAPSTE